jgi:hypothetical protein
VQAKVFFFEKVVFPVENIPVFGSSESKRKIIIEQKQSRLLFLHVKNQDNKVLHMLSQFRIIVTNLFGLHYFLDASAIDI